MNTEVIEEATVVDMKPEFVPGTNYNWKSNDELKIMGGELHILHNTLHSLFNEDVPQPQAWVLLHKCYEVTSALIKRGVEESIITEAPKS